MGGASPGVITPRERVLRCLAGEMVDRVACYSGMGNFSSAGLQECGYAFAAVHGDPEKMANLAASSHRLFGYECAVVPFDVGVEAEVVGCTVNYYPEAEQVLYPTVHSKVIGSPDEVYSLALPRDLAGRQRVSVVSEAIRLLKADIGHEVAIGSYLLGPFTLAWQIMDTIKMLKLCYTNPQVINDLVERLTGFIIDLAEVYQKAGVDYLTIREMSAASNILDPQLFERIIVPRLQKIFASISCAKILHICGKSNRIVHLMVQCGADAISVDQKNDLAETRRVIGRGPLVFGNLDGYSLMANGSPSDIEGAVLTCLDRGVDAVWPGCDLSPEIPLANLRTMVETVKALGGARWRRKEGVGSV